MRNVLLFKNPPNNSLCTMLSIQDVHSPQRRSATDLRRTTPHHTVTTCTLYTLVITVALLPLHMLAVSTLLQQPLLRPPAAKRLLRLSTACLATAAAAAAVTTGSYAVAMSGVKYTTALTLSLLLLLLLVVSQSVGGSLCRCCL